ncbi:MAG: VanW family protein [Frankiales bacterium]|nr:VanW family protein [Frankiales bacterium]
MLTTTGTAVGTVVAVRSGEALPGTTVAGQDVAGQDRRQLTATVEAAARDRTAGTLEVSAANATVEVERALVSVDVDTTVERALAAGRGGYLLSGVLGPLAGRGEPVAMVARVDPVAAATAVAGVAKQVDRAADDGGFSIQGTNVTARPPLQGRTVDTTRAVELLTTALLEGAPAVELPVTVTEPTTTAGDVNAVAAAATATLAGPYAVGTGTAVLRLTPRQVAPLLRAVPVDGTLALQVDTTALSAIVEEQAREFSVGSREAGFSVVSGAPTVDTQGDLTWTPKPAEVRVLPGAAGRQVNVEAATARFVELIVAAERNAPRVLPVTVVEPDLTTAGAQAARVRTLIGTFTTYYPAGRPRGKNIARIAEIINGSYLPAGEVFSLNKAAGERTVRRGFVADGAIVDGQLVDEVGGGVSQFATTLFNAAFFAGLPIVEHKPHSFYISRYPAGRESTVYFGALDVRFRNDTGNGIFIKTSSTSGSVTVELYGDNGGRQVSSSAGPRRARPDGGFQIAVTRTITGGDGVGARRVFSTSYDPAPE